MILAVIGYKQSGKDTVADYLVTKGFQKAQKLADPFKIATCKWFGWDQRHYDGDLKEVIDPKWGFSPRQFWQVFGTELMQYKLGELLPEYKKTCGRAIWVKVLKQWLDERTGDFVLSDMRFPHEAELIDATIIRLYRGENTDIHESETSIDLIKPDYEVYNTGTLDELYQKIDAILGEI